MATDATTAASRPPWASMVFIWTGRGPSCKAPGRHRGTLARPGVSVTSRAGPCLDFYRGDEPGGIRKRQSVTRQSDRFKLGWSGEVGLSGPGPLHLQSSSVPPSAGDSDAGTYPLRLIKGNGRSSLCDSKSHFNRSFGNVKAFNLKKIKIIAEPVAAMAAGGLRLGGDGRQVP